jgi:hypothetical protein
MVLVGGVEEVATVNRRGLNRQAINEQRAMTMSNKRHPALKTLAIMLMHRQDGCRGRVAAMLSRTASG